MVQINKDIMMDTYNSSDVSVIPNLPLIPKREPIDCNVSFEDFPDFENPVNTIIPFTTPYKIKDPVIVLERCDKILNTTNHAETTMRQEELYEDTSLSKIVVASVQGGVNNMGFQIDESEKLSVPQTTSRTSYIKYQPVLESISNLLPAFKLAVKDKQELFSCLICGQTYVKPNELRQHRRETHGEKPIRRSLKKHDSNQRTRKNSVDATQSSKISLNGNETKRKDAVENIVSNSVSTEISAVPNSLKANSGNLKNTSAQLETQKNEQSKIIVAEEKLNYSDTKGQQENTQTCKYNSVTCTLCSNTVQHLKPHLENYHKICCTDILLEELKRCFSKTDIPHNPILGLSEKEHNEKALSHQNTDPLNYEDNKTAKDSSSDSIVEDTSDAKEIVGNKRKRQRSLSIECLTKRREVEETNIDIENSNNDIVHISSFKCNICLGEYEKIGSFQRHSQMHFNRGETKENFHNCKNVYKNSPFYVGLTKTAIDPSRRTDSSTENKRGKIKTMEVRRHTTANCVPDKSSKSDQPSNRYSCVCGRSFRFVYNLYLHRTNTNCGQANMTTVDNAPKKSSGDKESGASINLTIKKNNNSYEVINMSNTDEENTKQRKELKSVDLPVSSSSNETHSTDNAVIIDEIHKYSKDHVILKLESAEEDNLINIEDDSDIEASSKYSRKQSSLYNARRCRMQGSNHITDKLEEFATSMLVRQPNTRETVTLDFGKPASKQDNTREVKTTCTCNKKFTSSAALHKHVVKTHPLLLKCEYCKKPLRNLEAYYSHACIAAGGPFDPTLKYISCYSCNALLNSMKEFDHHIQIEHQSPITEFKCYICFKNFDSMRLRYGHIKKCHDPQHCTICGATIRSSLKSLHECYHHGFGIPCHSCKRTFLTVGRFNKHVRRVHRKWMPNSISRQLVIPNLIQCDISSIPETCKLCKKEFINEASLKVHILSLHVAAYPWFRCPQCYMYAATKRTLDHHIKMKRCSKVRRNRTST